MLGSIAQRFRGPVATTSGTTVVTGYAKNYLYDARFGPRIELCDGHRIFSPEQNETHKARRMGGDPRNIDVWRAAADDWERF